MESTIILIFDFSILHFIKPFSLNLFGQSFSTGFDEAPHLHNKDFLWLDVAEQTGGVGDEYRGRFFGEVFFQKLGNRFQGIYIDAGVDLIEQGESRLEENCLESFQLFLFSAREPVIE